MTISSNEPKEIHNGNGSATVFSFSSFIINKASDLQVTKTDSQGNETVLVEGSGTENYSLTVANYPGSGSITFPATLGTELAANEKITIARVVVLEQETDLQNQGAYKPEQVESALDYSRMVDLQQQEQLDRSLKAPISDDSGADYTLPSPSSLGMFRWNEAANALELITSNDIATTVAFSNFKSDEFQSGVHFTPGSTTQLTLSENPGVRANTQVFFDGVYQVKSGYTLTDAVITFTSAIPLGVSSVEVTYGTAATQTADTDYWTLGKKGADLTSAATVDLSAATGDFVDITGTTTITSFGSVTAGREFTVQFDSNISVTYNATSMILPGNANMSFKAGDTAGLRSLGGGNWIMVWATRQSDFSGVCNGRLTLASGTAVTTTDQLAKTDIYLTPYKGSAITLHDGTIWNRFIFPELTLTVPAVANTMHDVFAYDNSGTVALEALAWTDDSNRATAIALQDGIYVKSGDTTRRYIGTFRTKALGQTEDSEHFRMVWNYYNRVPRSMRNPDDTGSWNYNTASWRQANSDTDNQLNFVVGVNEDSVEARVTASASHSKAGTPEAGFAVGIGIDSTTAASDHWGYATSSDNGVRQVNAYFEGLVSAGYHYLAWLEAAATTATTTYYASATPWAQSGISGKLLG